MAGQEPFIMAEEVTSAEEATFSSEVERVAALLETKKLVILQGPKGCEETQIAVVISRKREVPIKVLQIKSSADFDPRFDQFNPNIPYGDNSFEVESKEFVWRPSKFAQCLQQPCVILLKNLDKCPQFAADITKLAESGHVKLGNGPPIRMHEKCRILATISSDRPQQHLQAWRDCTVKLAPMQLETESPQSSSGSSLKSSQSWSSDVEDILPRPVTICRDKNFDLGFTCVGGMFGSPAYFIDSVSRRIGTADGNLHVGDRIDEVGGVQLSGKTQEEVNKLLGHTDEPTLSIARESTAAAINLRRLARKRWQKLLSGPRTSGDSSFTALSAQNIGIGIVCLGSVLLAALAVFRRRV